MAESPFIVISQCKLRERKRKKVLVENVEKSGVATGQKLCAAKEK